MYHQIIESVIGKIAIYADDCVVYQIRLAVQAAVTSEQANQLTQQMANELTEYFAGTRTAFDVPIAQPGTPFQQAVWHALTQIPYGQTRSYAEIATRAGHPRAYRAVGTANKHNRLPIVIPCHRVIQANGAIGGYVGGVAMKQFLLDVEKGTNARK